MRWFGCSVVWLVLFSTAISAEPTPVDLLKQAKTAVFLGDSITASGQYVAQVDAWIVSQRWEHSPKVIDCGLASETVSGLSEPGHAGGKFPRPDLAERLERVLALAKPDLVFSCYGINCGIYQPLDEQRLKKYQEGYQRLKSAVEKAGAKLIVVTPPYYDDQRSPKSFSYNGVLDKYSEWLLAQRQAGWVVIDLHGPMTREVQERRQDDPKFTFQPDGVHPNSDGHWFIARQLILALGDEAAAETATPAELLKLRGVSADLLPLVQQRMAVLRDAYVGTAGHKRPGVAPGLPVPEAEHKAAVLTTKINELLSVKP